MKKFNSDYTSDGIWIIGPQDEFVELDDTNSEYDDNKYGLSTDMIEMSFYLEDLQKSQKDPKTSAVHPAKIQLRSKISGDLFDLMMQGIFGRQLKLSDDHILQFYTLYEELGNNNSTILALS